MIRKHVAAALATLIIGGCTTTSQVGPYVKSVARNGAWLAVQKCTIFLVGETLEEGECTLEHVPLGSVPSVPAPMYPAAPTAAAPAYPAAPTTPRAPSANAPVTPTR